MPKRCLQEGIITILEDDAKLNTTIQDTLKVLNMPVQGFTRSDKFIGYWRANAAKIALVLLDLQLPCINGADLIPLIKHDNPLTKIIIITANTLQNLKLKLYFKGIDDFISKPFPPSLLVPLVRRRLEFPCDNPRLREDSEKYMAEYVYQIADNLVYQSDIHLLLNKDNDTALYLTNREDQLFRLFLVANSYTLYSEQILTLLPFIRDKKALSTWISRLNKKLTKLTPDLAIRSIYNVGYTLKTK